MSTKIVVVVENAQSKNFVNEHGLSLYIDNGRDKILFDTGAGNALLPNLKACGIDKNSIKDIFLSHGHNDHTGGLKFFRDATVFAASDIAKNRFSLHKNMPAHNISMPKESADALSESIFKESNDFTEIYDGIYLTGFIPRISGEDCGGPFFLDINGNKVDIISDEQAMLLKNGILIQGCCHSGIINTIKYCTLKMPDIKIRAIIGGFHLLNASSSRLEQTSKFLSENGIKQIYAMHCTGQLAIEYIKLHCENCLVSVPKMGDIIEID